MSGYSFHKGETWIVDAQFAVPTGDTLNGVSFKLLNGLTGALVLDLSVGSGVEIVDAAAGTATIQVDDADQFGFSPSGRYYFEAMVIFASGIRELQSEGVWVVLPTAS